MRMISARGDTGASRPLKALLREAKNSSLAHQPFFTAADWQRSQLFLAPWCSQISKGPDVQVINSTTYLRNAVFKESSNCFMRYSLSLPNPYIYIYIHTHGNELSIYLYTLPSPRHILKINKEHVVITLWDLEKLNDWMWRVKRSCFNDKREDGNSSVGSHLYKKG